ncbi:MAG: FAD-binding oxidoreductase [Bacteroidota bacterium]
MYTDTLIIGQGICGTWLSYWLLQAGAEFIVIDDANPASASRVASGIINPVTGRRMVKTWLADELLPFAEMAYKLMGDKLDRKIFSQTVLLDFFAAPDRRISFEKRATQFDAYLNWPEDEHAWLPFFNYPFGYGIVSPVYQVDIQTLLSDWRQILKRQNHLLEETYEGDLLENTSNGLCYKNIRAKRIIFCDGTAVMEQPYFNLLPFAINKGEALVINVPGLPADNLYKKTNVITPWKDGLFWVGSSYERSYMDDKPSPVFYEQTVTWLKQFLKLPFTIEDHLAALRPTTVERRPFAGMHPVHTYAGILNGMGTKGVSLAPFLAKQLAENILNDRPVMREVDVKMYTRILQRV